VKNVLEFTEAELAATGTTTPNELVRKLRSAGIGKVSCTLPFDGHTGAMEDHRARMRAWEGRKALIDTLNAKPSRKKDPIPFTEPAPEAPKRQPPKFLVTVEAGVKREHVLAALRAAEPVVPIALEGDHAIISTTPLSVGITGKPGAVVRLRWPGILPVSAAAVALDTAGKGSVTFLPAPGWRASAPIPVEFMYEADPRVSARLMVSFD
jgi:hypothetical protein